MAKPMTVTLGILGVLLLVGGTAAVSWLFLSGQTAQQTALAPSNIQATGEGLKAGNAATIRIQANDKLSASNAQQAITGYVMKTDAAGKFVAVSSATLSATARTNFNTVVGQKAKAIAFTGSFYGDLVDATATIESVDLDLPVYTIMASSGKWRWKDEDAQLDSVDPNGNISFAGSATQSNNIVLTWRNNVTDSVFDLDTILVDTANSSSLVTDLKVSFVGSTPADLVSGVTLSKCAKAPDQRRNNADYCFKLSKPIRVAEDQELRIDFAFTVNGNAGEKWDVALGDTSCYQAVRTVDGHSSNEIVCGAVENDAESPVDVGGAWLNNTMGNGVTTCATANVAQDCAIELQ